MYAKLQYGINAGNVPALVQRTTNAHVSDVFCNKLSCMCLLFTAEPFLCFIHSEALKHLSMHKSLGTRVACFVIMKQFN